MVEKYLLYSRIFFVTLIIMVTFPFVSQEIITPLKPLTVSIYLLSDAIFLVMGVATLRSRRDIIVFASFLVIGLFSSIIVNRESFLVSFNGMRSYFGLIFSIPILRWFLSGKNSRRFEASFDKLLFYFLVLQVPCIMWQFIKYGAGDRVGGSLGDWSSGLVSSLIYLISFYLVSKRWDYSDYIGSLKKNYVYFLLLLPTFFNETKASFIYLVLYFLLLIPLTLRQVKQLLVSLPLLMVLFATLGVIYLKVTNQDADKVLSANFFKEYVLGESTDHVLDLALAVEDYDLDIEGAWNGVFDMPRFTKLIVLPSAFKESHKSFITGAGLGQFKGTNVVGLTPFSKRYFWLLRGSKPFSFYLLVELGYLGIAWSIFVLASMFFPASRIKNGLNIKFYIAIILIFFYLYNDSLSSLYFCSILFYILMRTYYVNEDDPHLNDDALAAEQPA